MKNLPQSHSTYPETAHVSEHLSSPSSASFTSEPVAPPSSYLDGKQLSWPSGYQDVTVLCQATQQPLYRSFQPHQSPEYMTRVLKDHEDSQTFQSLLPIPRQPKLPLSVPSREKLVPKPPPLMQTPASYVFQDSHRRPMFEVYPEHHAPFRRFPYEEGYEFYRVYPQPYERQPLLYPGPRAAGQRPLTHPTEPAD